MNSLIRNAAFAAEFRDWANRYNYEVAHADTRRGELPDFEVDQLLDQTEETDTNATQ